MSNVSPAGRPPHAGPTPQPPVPGPVPASEPVPELAELATLANRPLAEHVTVLDALHRALAAQLSSAET